MFTTIDKITGKLIEPFKGGRGICKCCGGEVIAKCDTVKVPYWSHKSEVECDNWFEPMTKWHKDWQNQFPIENQEIVVFDKNTNEKHIADIHTNEGITIEIQHSLIGIEEFISRCKFYKDLIWVIDGSKYFGDMRFKTENVYTGYLDLYLNSELSNEFMSEIIPEYSIDEMNWVVVDREVIFILTKIQLYELHKRLKNDTELKRRYGVNHYHLYGSSLEQRVIITHQQHKRQITQHFNYSFETDNYHQKSDIDNIAGTKIISKTQVYIDNLTGRPDHLFNWNKREFVLKSDFINKHTPASKKLNINE